MHNCGARWSCVGVQEPWVPFGNDQDVSPLETGRLVPHCGICLWLASRYLISKNSGLKWVIEVIYAVELQKAEHHASVITRHEAEVSCDVLYEFTERDAMKQG